MSTPKANITVKLYNAGDVEIGSAITDVNGIVNFTNVPTGTYKAKATLPSGYTVDFGNFENSIVDNNALNNTLTSETGFGIVSGLDLATNSVVLATIIIGSEIELELTITAVTIHGCTLSLISVLPVASEIVVSLNYYIEDFVEGENPIQITEPTTSAFTMNIGDTVSNLVVIDGIPIETPINPNSRLRYTIVSRTPGRVVVSLPDPSLHGF